MRYRKTDPSVIISSLFIAPFGNPEGRFQLKNKLLTTYYFGRMIVFTGVDEGIGSFGIGEIYKVFANQAKTWVEPPDWVGTQDLYSGLFLMKNL